MQHVKIAHLFPDYMNVYGDWGNILALQKRCDWRKIPFEYVPIHTTDDLSKVNTCNMFFMGGGQDKEQSAVYDTIRGDIQLWQSTFVDLISRNMPGLLICGGYQMFGKSFVTADGITIPCIDILPIVTKPNYNGIRGRCIGNIVIEHMLEIYPRTLIGFENHGGQTFFIESLQKAQPLGKVLIGQGNAYKSKYEGCIYKNVIGTYLHGALLPKNPHMTDFFIRAAIAYNTQEIWQNIVLNNLDDSLELAGHDNLCKRFLA